MAAILLHVPNDWQEVCDTGLRFMLSLSQVPLGLVESAEVQHCKEELLLLCRDARSLR